MSATFVYTESTLERAFLPLARKAGWGKPASQRNLGHGRVDFYFDGRVIESTACDHRTASAPRTCANNVDSVRSCTGTVLSTVRSARTRVRRGYVVSSPPSTGSSTPVMYDAASDARNTAAATSSSASPVRPAGTRNII